MKLAYFAPLGLLALAACAPEIEANLYLQDIVEVADTGNGITIDAKLRIPENSEDSCKEGLAELTAKLATITPLKDEGECVASDGNQFSQFTLEMPVLPAGTDDSTHLAVVHVARADGALGAGLALSLTLTRSLTEVQKALGREDTSGSSVSLGPIASGNDQPKFIFEFQNDTRDTAKLVPNYLFVDDKPGLPIDDDAQSLDRREEVKLVFADVVAAYLAEANTYTFATVYPGGS